MTNREVTKPKPGDTVVLTKLPPGMLNDLPVEDQEAISDIVGKPILLREYDDVGRAELEFEDSKGGAGEGTARAEFGWSRWSGDYDVRRVCGEPRGLNSGGSFAVRSSSRPARAEGEKRLLSATRKP